MKFNTEFVDYDEHSVLNYPTVRIKVKDGYKLGITMNKWIQESPRGKLIAIYVFEPTFKLDDKFWESPESTQYYKQILGNVYDLPSTIDNDENIQVFKYHSNQWRPVKKVKDKWKYMDKLDKEQKECNIHILQT
tara:strand:- start:2453 stop:2854 length:402 start_codon:yes stop_codon:yes gene_type:complete